MTKIWEALECERQKVVAYKEQKNIARVEKREEESRKYAKFLFENCKEDLCIECGSTCCKNGGCYLYAENFGDISLERLREEIEKGYISIGFIEDPEYYSLCGIFVLRVRSRGEKIVNIMSLEKTRDSCMLLGKNGCLISEAGIEKSSVRFVPKTDCHGLVYCEEECDMYDLAIGWKKYQAILDVLAKDFELFPEDFPCMLRMD